jgi:hypothetical protein
MAETPDQRMSDPGEPAKQARAKPTRPKPVPARKSLPSPLAVIVATLGLFLVVLTLLVIQVRNGRDPALGPGPVVPVISKPGTAGTQTQATTIVSRTSPAPPP